ncbi:MAG TPA: EamA family transporter [Solirubrobacteraceae bacterium]|jgi:drug/metabolite transporter (DMT)-like permease|nr:EamA family transporter [Solirubrobacteraceae bacterium]
MLAAALALASSLSWGLSDFLGGLQSRRHSVLAVLVLSQGLALVVLVIAIAAGAPTAHDGAATAWAAGSGLLGILGLSAFYRALAIGTMSIVAPLSATGVAIPVLVGLASGERPSTLQLLGIALATAGVVLAGREAAEPDAEARRAGRTAVLLALLAAVGFGSFFAGIDRAEESADLVWVLFAARAPEVLVVLAVCAIRRPPLPSSRKALGAIAAIGVLDLLANLLFVLATGRGLLSVVGVLGALYPAVTVVLARTFLHERLTQMQNAGVLVTLAGVAALAAGG